MSKILHDRERSLDNIFFEHLHPMNFVLETHKLLRAPSTTNKVLGRVLSMIAFFGEVISDWNANRQKGLWWFNPFDDKIANIHHIWLDNFYFLLFIYETIKYLGSYFNGGLITQHTFWSYIVGNKFKVNGGNHIFSHLLKYAVILTIWTRRKTSKRLYLWRSLNTWLLWLLIF